MDTNWLLPSVASGTNFLHKYYLWSNRNMVSAAFDFMKDSGAYLHSCSFGAGCDGLRPTTRDHV